MDGLRVVIPAGGLGTRLWPLSRAGRPKFLVDIGTGEPLIHDAIRRALRVADPEDVYVVTGREHASLTEEAISSFGVANLLVEPSPRDTTAAIALGTLVAGTDARSIILSIPADHLIRDEDRGWERTIAMAVSEAAQGRVACVGVHPTSAHTGYGYAQVEPRPLPGGTFRVLRFREKPEAATAQQYMSSGDHFWNTAIGAWQAGTFTSLLHRYAPDIALVAEAGADAIRTSGALAASLWDKVRSVAIEYALLEPAAEEGILSLVPSSFRWWDVGTWSGVGDAVGQASSSPAVLMRDTTNCVLHITHSDDGERRYAFLGVQDLVVVDTGDVVLVTHRSAAERVKEMAAAAREHGWGDLT
jgi:mannose-1-phosphate guanylyltransferase